MLAELAGLARDLGIFAIGGGFLYLLGKFGIKQYFDKELKKYQAELDKERVRYSELQQKRGQKIEELYKKFVEFEHDMRRLTDIVTLEGEPDKTEKLKNAQDTGEDFVNFYAKNKIYFPPDACETIEEIQEEMQDVFNTFRIERPFEAKRGGAPDIETWTENWNKISEDEVPELKRELENQFRSLLGVQIEATSEDSN